MENSKRIISARAFGILIAVSLMEDGISNERLAKRFQESIGTIQKATAELRQLGLLKTTTSNVGNYFVSTTDLTEEGRYYVQRVLARFRFENGIL